MSGLRRSKSKSKSKERKGECFLCCKPCSLVCGACELVHYCSQDHLLTHRQQNYCFPFRITWKQSKGRSVVATRDIDALELILFDAAIAYGPRNMNTPVCLECGKKVDKSYHCGMCNMPMCGPTCQVGQTHYNECQFFRGLRESLHTRNFEDPESPIYQCIAPLRLLQKKTTHPKWFKRLGFLMDHGESREMEGVEWNEKQKKIVNFLLQSCGLKDFTEEDIHWAIGLMRTNAVSFGDGSGRAVFPTFSMINHNCVANAKHTVYLTNKRIAVQAQVSIKKGEEILISYITFTPGTLFRRMKLKKFWFFDCNCDRCSDPTELGTHMSSLVCPKCEEGWLTQKDPLDKDSPWTCKVHRFQLTADNYKNMVIDMKCEVHQEGERGSIERLEGLLNQYSQILHPHHYLMMIIKRNIISLYSQAALESITRKGFCRIRDLCEESLQVLGTVDPGYAVWKGETLKDLGTCMMNLARHDFEEKRIDRPTFLAQVKQSILKVDEASKCKSCVRVDRKEQDSTSFKEE